MDLGEVVESAEATDSLPREALESELTEFAAHLSAAERRWLALVAEFDRRELHLEWGCHTCAAWLTWRCGLDPRSAREKVRVARALDGLPLIGAEFGKGRLSYSKVRALTRIATPENEQSLVDVALGATAAHMERIARSYRRALNRHDGKEQARRYLRCEWNDDGSLAIHGQLSAERGALFLKALEAALEHITDAEPESEYGTTQADALALMAESFLETGPATRCSGDRYQIVLNVDTEVLAHDADGECAFEEGPGLDPETARRIACDSSIVLVERGSVGELLNIGRKTRSIPRAIRRALRKRDKTCRWPGCDETRWLDAHHGRHWAHGGETSLANLVHLCWFHHRLAHEGGWTLEIRANGEVAVTKPSGDTLETAGLAAGVADGSGIVARNRALELAIDENTGVAGWSGERLDLDHAITALLCLDRPGFAVCDPPRFIVPR